ncbi:uncharacterized protein LOC129792356 [Lutzomyia longipalpis]|uniref:uncharacterized protein LOC129792356 n=1 Tax=Lutzomyia longipalpis TaxID=7200 RepID=UPI002483D042|nr:uncharacterized protein LOC129792356 [Lutzomyia longipalpis]
MMKPLKLYGGRFKKKKVHLAKNKNYFEKLGIVKPNILIRGSYYQDNLRLFGPYSNNKQCTANAIIAIIASHLYEIENWNEKLINDILIEGNKLYNIKIERTCEGLLNAEDIVYKDDKVISVFGKKLTLNCITSCYENLQGEFYGKFEYKTFQYSLKYFFENFTYGVITCSNLSVAIFKQDDYYYVFDSHSRGEFGQTVYEKGTAVLCGFTCIEHLYNILKYNFFNGSEDYVGEKLFTITPFEILANNIQKDCENVEQFGIMNSNTKNINVINNFIDESSNTHDLKKSTSHTKHSNSKYILKKKRELHKAYMKKVHEIERTNPNKKEECNIKNRIRHKIERTDPVKKDKDNEKRTKRRKIEELDPKKKEKNNAKRLERHKIERTDPNKKDKDNTKRKIRHKIERTDSNKKEKDNIKRKIRHKIERTNLVKKEEDNYKRTKRRKIEELDQMKKLKNNSKRKERHKNKRNDPVKKEVDNYKRTKRRKIEELDQMKKLKNNIKRKERHKNKRNDPVKKEVDNYKRTKRRKIEELDQMKKLKNNIKRKERHKIERTNKNKRDIENVKRKNRHKKERMDPKKRAKENLARKIRLKLERKRAKIKNIIKILRYEKSMNKKTNILEDFKSIKDKRLITFYKRNINTNRLKEKYKIIREIKDKDKNNVTDNPPKSKETYEKLIMQFRKNKTKSLEKIIKKPLKKKLSKYMKHKIIQIKDKSKTILEFFNVTRKKVPNYVCASCEGLFFKHSVQLLKIEKCKYHDKNYLDEISKISDYCCTTCYNSLNRNKLPTLATKNGLKFPDIPECLLELNELEERMCSPIIPFMTIRELKHYLLNAQKSLKGSTVHIPVEVNEMLQVLPRTFDNMQTVQVKLLRHLKYKNHYMFQTVRPPYIIKAMKYLVTTPLYKEKNIKLDEKYVNLNENVDEINFIVDPKDDEVDIYDKETQRIFNIYDAETQKIFNIYDLETQKLDDVYDKMTQKIIDIYDLETQKLNDVYEKETQKIIDIYDVETQKIENENVIKNTIDLTQMTNELNNNPTVEQNENDLKNILEETILKDTNILKFWQLANKQFPTNVMQDLLYINAGELQRQQRTYVKKFPKDCRNIQILFLKPTQPNGIGHYVTTLHENGTIHVYDSLYLQNLDQDCINFLNDIYPESLVDGKLQIKFEKTFQQNDGLSCGVHAIANTVTLLYNLNPSHMSYNVKEMRKHLYNMLCSQKIAMFPVNLEKQNDVLMKDILITNSQIKTQPKNTEDDREKILENCYLTDKHIYDFWNQANDQFINNVMQDILFIDAESLKQQQEYIQKFPKDFRNVQILFLKPKYENEIGHYVTTLHENGIIYVYDSLFLQRLDQDCIRFLKTIYPESIQNDQIELKFEKTFQQNDTLSCGVHAIANSVTLLHNLNPSNISYNVKEMRKHLYNMLNTKTITMFPIDLQKETETKSQDIITSKVKKNNIPVKQENPEEVPDEFDLINEDIMILNLTDIEIKQAQIQMMAPGMNKRPVYSRTEKNLEELSFIKIYGGQKIENQSISYSNRIKAECRNRDRRCADPTKVLYSANEKMQRSIFSAVNVCLRKSKNVENMTANDALTDGYLDKLREHDDGYNFLKTINLTPAYWAWKKNLLLQMIKQLGKPTLFLTLTISETRCPELIQELARLQGMNLSLEESMFLSEDMKTRLVRDDPVTCARYFDEKCKNIIKMLQINPAREKNRIGPFGKHYVVDYFVRTEFQMRGSAHQHILLWLNDFPQIDESNPETFEEAIKIIDQIITCQYKDPENLPYIRRQMHIHCSTCYKKKKDKCRFNYPIPPLDKTEILLPIAKEEKTEKMKENYQKIANLTAYFSHKHEEMNFPDILKKLKMTREEYIMALRSSIKRSRMFLKRSSKEVNINAYNESLIMCIESNMDIQFVVEIFALAKYVADYVSKAEAGVSKMLKEINDDTKKQGNVTLREKMCKMCNGICNCKFMSAQEAAMSCLCMPMSRCSRSNVVINTRPINERVRILKPNAQLKKLDKNSKNIFAESIFDKYSKRDNELENVTLIEYAADYYMKKKTDEEENDDDVTEYGMRKKSKIVMYKGYKEFQDPNNYYREQVLLFLPWRNEKEEIEDCDCRIKYMNNRQTINAVRKKFCYFNDDGVLTQIIRDRENENEDDHVPERDNPVDSDQEIDMFPDEKGGTTSNKKGYQYVCPERIQKEDICKNLQQLNVKQREIVMYIYQCIRTGNLPLRIFLSGSAGVGKSKVINCLYQLITQYYDNLPGSNPESIKVLLTAPSGKAAFLINGMTIHTAFAINNTKCTDSLSPDAANTIRSKLKDVQVLIVDEISMVGSNINSKMDNRMRQICGVNESYGGKSVIFVGDLKQLKPVKDKYVFEKNLLHTDAEFVDYEERNVLWEEFKYYELTEIMRQKDDLSFTVALNNLANGTMTEDDIKLIQSRQVENDDKVPLEAIRLFYYRKHVRSYNNNKIENFPGDPHLSVAKDKVLESNTTDKKAKEDILAKVAIQDPEKTGGCMYELKLKIGIKYMVINNIDVEDGLVNGATGTLRHITFNPTDNSVHTVWLEFPEDRVGRKLKCQARFQSYLTKNNLPNNLVPIERQVITFDFSEKSKTVMIARKQLPLIPGEAVTIHKSQGQTYNSICIDFTKGELLNINLIYVAFSRVVSLLGLFIIGKFKVPKAQGEDHPIQREMKRLKNEKLLIIPMQKILCENKDKFKICYQNIVSLNKHFNDVKCDIWYKNFDIIVLSETKTIKDIDVPILENYKIIYRCDNEIQKIGGLLCYVKNDCEIEIKIKSEQLYSNREKVFSVTLFLIEINNNLSIITGYKSPQTPFAKFKNSFENLYSQVANQSEVIIMGDFNFNTYEGKEDKNFVKLMKEYNLSNQLDPKGSTTKCDNQLDVIFSNIVNPIVTGIYESYFSDHKPVYCMLSI